MVQTEQYSIVNTEPFCFNLYKENWKMYDFKWWFRLGKGVATFEKISQVSYMWTRLIVVSISDWVNLDHLRISTFCWTKPRIQHFPDSYSSEYVRLLEYVHLFAIWVKIERGINVRTTLWSTVKHHLMPFRPQKFIMNYCIKEL